MKKLSELIEKLNLQKLKEKKFLTFKVMDKNFKNEILIDLYLPMTVLSNVKLNKIEFKNLDLELSSFYNCNFTNCSFTNCYFGNLTCGNCQFQNCQFVESTIKDADFHKVTFTNCNFLKNSFVETWFRSCKFINTSIEKSDEDDLMVTIIVDSTFGKSDKSLTFNGEFFLADILLPSNKIIEMKSSNFNNEEIRALELQSSKMESSKQALVPGNKQLSNDRQIISRLILLSTIIYLGIIFIDRF